MALIRIRVPLVRPLVRCTFKRILRILPSILLLLFVFSLIFVTLMQIAVIHSHRRTHYVAGHHESFNVTSLPTAGHTVLGKLVNIFLGLDFKLYQCAFIKKKKSFINPHQPDRKSPFLMLNLWPWNASVFFKCHL